MSITIFTFFTIINLSAQENTALLCSDGTDNDGDGLIDCYDSECIGLANGGCATCLLDGLSFADFVIDYSPSCPENISHNNVQSTLGVSDFSDVDNDEYVSLGTHGSITLGFSNNLVVNSGNADPDIWIFEVGPSVEPCAIALKPFNQSTIDLLNSNSVPDSDGDGYFEVGSVAGSTSAIDIDAVISGIPAEQLKFDAIKITDLEGNCYPYTPGADIDAVCALSSIVLDCAGVPNGTAVVDTCGVCLEPTDPNFNLSCVEFDCAGVPNGTAIIDTCGICLEPNDPEFNLSCVSGEASFDIPNVFTPNQDGVNDIFKVFYSGHFRVIKTTIYNRWGETIFEGFNNEEWDGTYKGEPAASDVYLYYVIYRENGNEGVTSGEVTLLR